MTSCQTCSGSVPDLPGLDPARPYCSESCYPADITPQSTVSEWARVAAAQELYRSKAVAEKQSHAQYAPAGPVATSKLDKLAEQFGRR